MVFSPRQTDQTYGGVKSTVGSSEHERPAQRERSCAVLVYSATKFAVRALSEGLRMEHRADNIRCTIISPGAVATELPESSSEEATRKNLREFYKMAIPADSLAHAIAYAIEQPADVEIGEVVIRPAAQDF